MNFLSHTLVLLLTLAAGFPAGAPCAAAQHEACRGHVDAAASSMAGGECAASCPQGGAETRCEASAGETEPAVLAKAASRPSPDDAALPHVRFSVGRRHLLQKATAVRSRTADCTSLQTQHIRLQV